MKRIFSSILIFAFILFCLPGFAVSKLTIDAVEQTDGGTYVNPSITGGTIDDCVIGGTTAADATFQDTLTLKDGTDIHKIKAVDEPGLGGRLTIGLDETARTMVICDVGDVDTDFGLSIKAEPRFYIYNAAANAYSSIDVNSLTIGNYLALKYSGSHFSLESYASAGTRFLQYADIASGNLYKFLSDTNAELTDTNAEQSWMYLEPKINQSATAAYNGLKIKVTETALGDASTGDGGGTNNLILAGTSAIPNLYQVDNKGRIRGTGVISRTITDADVTLTTADFGKSIRMSSAADHVASLPSVEASDDGAKIRIVKTGAGKVTVDAADSDLINDSGAGDTIYNDVAAETYAFIDLEYVHAIVTWIATGTGIWVTTD